MVPALLALTAAGCAQPQGEIFAPLDKPLVWPAGPEPARIRYMGCLTGSADLKAAVSGGENFQAALRGPRQAILFSAPHAVAVRAARWLAVTDPGQAGVHLIDLDLREHTLVCGWAGERFATPLGVCWVGERLFVTDAARHEVVELTATGVFRRSFGAADLSRPVGIAPLAEHGQLCVVDGGAHCLAVFDLDGRLVTRLGQGGVEPGEFNYPAHIWAGPSDRLLVTDSGNFRVQLLDPAGRPLTAFGQKGDGAGDFSLPKGVACDSAGHIYVVDAHFENVQIFDAAGRLLLAFGEEGAGPGKFSLPAGLAIDTHDRIWVADSGNRRLQVFDYLRDAG